MPGFVSGITGGLLLIELGVGGFWAMLELVNVEAPATSKIAAPVAKDSSSGNGTRVRAGHLRYFAWAPTMSVPSPLISLLSKSK